MIRRVKKIISNCLTAGGHYLFGCLLTVQLVFMTALFGCDDNHKLNQEQHNEVKTVRIESPAQNPLQHALSIIGLNPADLVRPLYHEEGYQLVGRIPLIDRVAQSPFFLHHWADDTSHKLQYNAEQRISETLSFTLMSLNGGVSYKNKHSLLPDDPTLLNAYRYLCRQYGVMPDKSILQEIRQADFQDEFDRQLGRLIYCLTESTLMATSAVAGLSPQELSYLVSRPERYFYPRGHQFSFLTAATHTQFKIVSITRKIDFVSLYSAALSIAQALDRFSEYINRLDDSTDPDHFYSDGKPRAGYILDVSSPIGRIVIGGLDNNVYSGSAALIIDLGGNDRFSGPVAAGHLEPGRISIAVDISGNDIYSRKKKQLAQGAGFLSVGMLIDLSGDDRYVAGDMAQGAGIYGVGVLADYRGNDYYRMGSMGQGFGVFGVGMLLDKDGNDKYLISAMGQGTGSTLGYGVLCDLRGNDKYFADRTQQLGKLIPDDLSHVQGAGLSIRSPDWVNNPSIYGGIGFLSDGGGNDFYFASNGNSMGSSYFMSIGALVDHNGNDKYIPKGGYGLAYAVHLSNAVFIDRSGDDYYFAKTHTGGVGSDRSIAIMADYDGNDIYGPSIDFVRNEIEKDLSADEIQKPGEELEHRIQKNLADVSFGSALKPKALGFLIDYRGNDRYFARKKGWGESLGGVLPPASPKNWNHALLLDLGGNDRYFAKNRKNNHYALYYQHGLCYDTEYGGGKTIGKEPLPVVQPYLRQSDEIFNELAHSPILDDLHDLIEPDLFIRYAAIGRISQKTPRVVSDLIAVLENSVDQRLNAAVIETLTTFILLGKINLKQFIEFESLLGASDPSVRRYAARTLGWFNITRAAPALVEALGGEENEDVRANIIWALGQTGSEEAMGLLASKVQTEFSLICRRSAVMALGNLTKKIRRRKASRQQKYTRVLLDALGQPDEIIKTYAAAALVHLAEDAEVIDALREHLDDASVYVKREAARALILNNRKEGIPVLIETLQYPSIDTFEHYDHELAKDLAYYTGVDFPESQRYDYSTWRNWWQTNESELNLKRNLAIMKDIQRAFGASNEEKGIAIFERLKAENPENVVVRNRYQRFCYEWITFRLLTRDQITGEILKRCLRLQTIKAELEPENPQTIASLAYFYARLNNFDQAISYLKRAIQMDPENSGYNKTLELYVDKQKRVRNANDS